MRPAFTHVALHVRDVAATVAFYREFCGLEATHERPTSQGSVTWLATPGNTPAFAFVLLPGGAVTAQSAQDYSHFGFAVDSTEEVDRIAAQARVHHCLVWSPRSEPYPVGYYCGVSDPDGRIVEFSFGQPLGTHI